MRNYTYPILPSPERCLLGPNPITISINVSQCLELNPTILLLPPLAFFPQSKVELKSAVDTCLGLSPADCSHSPHGPIENWDVSRIDDMNPMFQNANSFNGDISKWDVSSVTEMGGMLEITISVKYTYANADDSR